MGKDENGVRMEESRIREYRDGEILGLIVNFLNRRCMFDLSEGNLYDKFLEMGSTEALNALQPRLETIRKLDTESKGQPQRYFLDEASYLEFLDEMIGAEALEKYFTCQVEEKPIPVLTMDERYQNRFLAIKAWVESV